MNFKTRKKIKKGPKIEQKYVKWDLIIGKKTITIEPTINPHLLDCVI